MQGTWGTPRHGGCKDTWAQGLAVVGTCCSVPFWEGPRTPPHTHLRLLLVPSDLSPLLLELSRGLGQTPLQPPQRLRRRHPLLLLQRQRLGGTRLSPGGTVMLGHSGGTPGSPTCCFSLSRCRCVATSSAASSSCSCASRSRSASSSSCHPPKIDSEPPKISIAPRKSTFQPKNQRHTPGISIAARRAVLYQK